MGAALISVLAAGAEGGPIVSAPSCAMAPNATHSGSVSCAVPHTGNHGIARR